MRFLYLLLIFLIPSQFGKHFWPDFSFIGGLRVDYLSPTLYVTDILIFILAILCAYRACHSEANGRRISLTRSFASLRMTKKTIILFSILFFATLLLGVIFAKNQQIAVYGLVKLLEMIFFSWYTSRVVGKTISLSSVAWALGAGVLLESSLAILQFFSGGSLGGLFYFFGERTFSAITPGIANASLQGQLVLRPYGTLPHPNVLAGYLLIAMIFIASQWKGSSRMMFGIALFLGTTALFLSLSRTTIVLFLLLVVFWIGVLLKKKIFSNRHPGRKSASWRTTDPPAKAWHWRAGRISKKDSIAEFTLSSSNVLQNDIKIWVIGLLGVVGIFGVVGGLVVSRFRSLSFLEESFVVRADLLQNAWWMVSNHPFFGVGLMNFLVRLPAYQHTQSFYLHLQPVHNIFALMAAEVGILGFFGILGLFVLTVKHVWRASSTPLRMGCLVMLFSVFFLGMFDHYFVTLQSGQLLFSFVLGLCYSLSSQTVKKKQLKKRLVISH